jgi:opacity protein-like surface antigen
MKKTAFVLVAAAAATFAGHAGAQVPLPTLTPFSVEARGGLSVPTGDQKDGAKTGWTAGASLTYHALPLFGIYAGYSMDQWSLKDDIGGGKLKDQGLDVGARLGIPTPMIPIDPWIRAGAVYHKVKISDNAVLNGDSDNKWGWEVGAGLGFALGPKVSVTPGVTYTKIHDLDVQHVRADIGLRIRI